MWVFLAQEIMFFGGMFAAYLIYRLWYYAGYAAASQELDLMLGGINTAVLIGSSLTVALAVHAAQEGKQSQTVGYLGATLHPRPGVPRHQVLRVQGRSSTCTTRITPAR